MRTVTVRHYWQDYNDDQVCDGDIDAAVQSAEHVFSGPHGFRDLVHHLVGSYPLNDGVLNDGYEVPERPETCDGGETLCYHLRWPGCYLPGVDDVEHRTGSVHIDGPGATPLLYSQIIRICNVYDANGRNR